MIEFHKFNHKYSTSIYEDGMRMLLSPETTKAIKQLFSGREVKTISVTSRKCGWTAEAYSLSGLDKYQYFVLECMFALDGISIDIGKFDFIEFNEFTQ